MLFLCGVYILQSHQKPGELWTQVIEKKLPVKAVKGMSFQLYPHKKVSFFDGPSKSIYIYLYKSMHFHQTRSKIHLKPLKISCIFPCIFPRMSFDSLRLWGRNNCWGHKSWGVAKSSHRFTLRGLLLLGGWTDLFAPVRHLQFHTFLVTLRIHVWYICPHLVDFYGKCRQIYHTWILRVIMCW